MKKFNNLFNGILISLSMFGLLACSSTSSDETSLTQEELDSIERAVDELMNEYNSAPTKAGAISVAKSFIRSEFASNADFIEEGTIVEDSSVPGRFKVLQRFDAEDHPSGWSKFIYRIWVQRFEDGTWEFGNLAVESITGEKVLTTNGNMKEREQNDGVGTKINAAGIEFTIAERNPTAIRIYSDLKLTTDEMREVIKELMNQYDTIQFATAANHDRGDEYASWTSGIFCNFDSNEVLSRDKFL